MGRPLGSLEGQPLVPAESDDPRRHRRGRLGVIRRTGSGRAAAGRTGLVADDPRIGRRFGGDGVQCVANVDRRGVLAFHADPVTNDVAVRAAAVEVFSRPQRHPGDTGAVARHRRLLPGRFPKSRVRRVRGHRNASCQHISGGRVGDGLPVRDRFLLASVGDGAAGRDGHRGCSSRSVGCVRTSLPEFGW